MKFVGERLRDTYGGSLVTSVTIFEAFIGVRAERVSLRTHITIITVLNNYFYKVNNISKHLKELLKSYFYIFITGFLETRSKVVLKLIELWIIIASKLITI